MLASGHSTKLKHHDNYMLQACISNTEYIIYRPWRNGWAFKALAARAARNSMSNKPTRPAVAGRFQSKTGEDLIQFWTGPARNAVVNTTRSSTSIQVPGFSHRMKEMCPHGIVSTSACLSRDREVCRTI